MMQILESKDAVIDDLTKKLAATEQDQAEAACMQMEVGWLVQSAAEAKHELDALQREIVSGLQNDLRGNIEGSLRSVAEAKKEPDALQKEPAVQLEDLRRGVGWLVQSAAEAKQELDSLHKELVTGLQTETALCTKLAETLSEIIAGVQRELEGINHAAESAQNQVDLVQDGACHPSFGRWFRAGPKTKEESRKATELERMLKVVTEEKKLIAEQLEKIQQEHTHCKAQINEIKATLSGLDASIAAELVDAVNDLRGDMEGLVQHLDELKEVSHCLHEGVCL